MSNTHKQIGNVTVKIDGLEFEYPIFSASIGNNVVDFRAFAASSNMWSYDPAFLSTAACESKITYIDGEKGELLYRGYAIEELASCSSYIETAYLVMYGELPNQIQLAEFSKNVLLHSAVDSKVETLYQSFTKDMHPMNMLMSAVSYMANIYHTDDACNIDYLIQTFISKIPTLVAMCYRIKSGLPFIQPDTALSYSENFLNMMFGDNGYKSDATVIQAVDRILLLHADHEQNASTSTVRLVGSSGASIFASIVAGIACLSGPAHGGANEAVLDMLHEIGTEEHVNEFIAGVKNKEYKLMGFGHRVYKNTDPRAKIIRETCHDVLNVLQKHDDQLFKLALTLEQSALHDSYFIEKKLYPNVDFYSGIILEAIGVPSVMFTAVFVMARMIGWLSQWREMINDPESKIGRPRQLYTGNTLRCYVNINNRI